MYPVDQPLGAESAREKGNRKTIRPETNRKQPSAIQWISNTIVTVKDSIYHRVP
jgi:hypothetical protein